MLAHAVRGCVREIGAQLEPDGAPLWFQGHWGFQFYLQAAGASPVDVKTFAPQPGARVAIPSNNTNLLPPNPAKTVLLETVMAAGPHLITTWSQTVGAGFYSSVWGPLPFAVGKVPGESVSVYALQP